MEPMNPETDIVNHEEPYHGKIVSLHVDTIRQASGRTTVREVIHHPGGVAAVPVLEDSDTRSASISMNFPPGNWTAANRLVKQWHANWRKKRAIEPGF